MYETFKGDKGREIRTWLPTAEMEPQAMAQLMAAAGHPRLGDFIAVMPDCHLGVGVTIGCVLPTMHAVIPNAVGVDIGCGMTYVKTRMPYHEGMDAAFWNGWAARVRETVPMGFNAHKYEKSLGPQLSGKLLYAEELNAYIETKAVYQIGTLGGGNHFLEAQVTADGYVAFMVHSGSRHIGLQIANYYNQKALEENARTRVLVPKDLAYLDAFGDAYHQYLADMTWALIYAYESRDRMLHRLVNAFEDTLSQVGIRYTEPLWYMNESINIHHNYAEANARDGMVIHRKGATYAGAGQLGVIPGSMGAKSYIVRGKGNPDSLWSCSHGAGRQMSRGAAKRALTLQDFQDSVTGTYSPVSLAYIDEAPGAYKDIDRVMEQQADLVEIVDTLSPIMTLKGSSKAKDD